MNPNWGCAAYLGETRRGSIVRTLPSGLCMGVVRYLEALSYSAFDLPKITSLSIVCMQEDY